MNERYDPALHTPLTERNCKPSPRRAKQEQWQPMTHPGTDRLVTDKEYREMMKKLRDEHEARQAHAP